MIHRFRCLACKGEYSETDAHGIAYAHVCGPLPADKKTPERERPDKRDENALMDGRGLVVGIRDEGAGVKCLTASHLSEPLWISALYKRIEQREEKENA